MRSPIARLRARCYDAVMEPVERSWLDAVRAQWVGRAHGRVLEIGAGTGANLRHYRPDAAVTACEPDPDMRARLAERARVRHIEVVDAPATHLPFADATFDDVVATLVFCSVPAPAAALAEVRRVLRPGGRLIGVEHVRSTLPDRARMQRRVTPAWRCVTGGCDLARDTLTTVERAGFEVVERERVHGPIARVVGPFVAFAAVRR